MSSTTRQSRHDGRRSAFWATALQSLDMEVYYRYGRMLGANLDGSRK